MHLCCILTLDRDVNLRILWTRHSCVNMQKKSHGRSEIVGVRKWYTQMPEWGSKPVAVSVSLESDPVCSHGERPLGQRPTAASGWVLSGQEAELLNGVLKIAWYGQEKNKLWVNIAIRLCHPPSACLSHTLQSLDAKKNKESYIFYKEEQWSCFPAMSIPSSRYTTLAITSQRKQRQTICVKKRRKRTAQHWKSHRCDDMKTA